MQVGGERDRLVGAVAELEAELGRSDGDERGSPVPAGDGDGDGEGGNTRCAVWLSAEDNALVTGVGEALGRLASAAEARRAFTPPPSAKLGAVGGAEMVMRAELARGRGERLAELLPSFVYVATLPHLGQEAALGLAQRTRELLAGDGSAG